MRIKSSVLCFLVGIATTVLAATPTSAQSTAGGTIDVSDEALVATLPGFRSGNVEANGVRLHFVAGGSGNLVVLLPGWPETWWGYHKIMPELAKTHRVLSLDIRGMGASDKPAGGYDKKTMAEDVSQLLIQLGYDKADIVGHDIGAMVAFSLAANHPNQVQRLVMLDVAHPSAGYLKIPLLPDKGTFGDKIDEDHPYFWWFAFHQVKGLPEDLLEGRAGLEHAWFFRYMMKDEAAIDARDRAVYAAAYSSRDAIRASNGWYQAFAQDVADDAGYSKLTMPVLGLGATAYSRLKATLDVKAPGSKTIKIEGSGHFIAEEKPDVLLDHLGDFLK
ncbi:pimeloyl-ACP methyl ester carboxylesterase [Tardiphaga robiniae]|uniref:alpha/beta fold hydrolase n=1 Tax=Tardiphaga robiniae TaxID=943830 RepID=UPI00285681B3|nr:alpha/beta hydrolase [Tardiphaga robiniae]MDR6660840.1 pimeloyl-ACP methyl ester carboxylesterase [Tardiphaga robiniae]